MRPNTCNGGCDAVRGQRGAWDRYGKWHKWPDLDGMNRDVGEFLFDGYPAIKKVSLSRDGNFCQHCRPKAAKPANPPKYVAGSGWGPEVKP